MGEITVVGTGLRRGQLTLEGAAALRSAGSVILHTARCEAADWLRDEGIAFESLDSLYDAAEDFDVHADMAARAVLEAARAGDVVYAVFDVRDLSVRRLAALLERPPRVLAGPPSEGALMALTGGDMQLADASDWPCFRLSARRDTLVREIATRQLAGEVKLKLMEVYPEEMDVWVLLGGRPVKLPLPTLDRLKGYDHTTSVLAPAQTSLGALERYDFDHLLDVMAILRAPGGCPWDRAQTHDSLRASLAEEAYEAIDAIDRGETDDLYDELGDLLMQIVLHAQIAKEHGEFDISDVTTAICRKMISRHAHVFGDARADTPEDVLNLWQAQKRRERGYAAASEAMAGVTKGLPALMRAEKLLARAEDGGLREDAPVAAHRLTAAAARAAAETDADSVGALLLAAANLARILGVDAETALRDAGNRFVRAFADAERASGAGAALPETAVREMWQKVKL